MNGRLLLTIFRFRAQYGEESCRTDQAAFRKQPLQSVCSFTLIELLVIKICQAYNLFPYPALRKREGFGERKRRLAPRLSPYQISSTSFSFPASSRASANALQAASRSKNVKLPFRKKAGRQLHIFANLPSPPSDRCSACRPSRTRRRHLAGRGPAAKALVAPAGAKSSVGDYPAVVLR